jgi:hypothetical protein
MLKPSARRLPALSGNGFDYVIGGVGVGAIDTVKPLNEPNWRKSAALCAKSRHTLQQSLGLVHRPLFSKYGQLFIPILGY